MMPLKSRYKLSDDGKLKFVTRVPKTFSPTKFRNLVLLDKLRGQRITLSARTLEIYSKHDAAERTKCSEKTGDGGVSALFPLILAHKNEPLGCLEH